MSLNSNVLSNITLANQFIEKFTNFTNSTNYYQIQQKLFETATYLQNTDPHFWIGLGVGYLACIILTWKTLLMGLILSIYFIKSS